MEEQLNLIFKRRSIRKFQDKPVEDEKISLLLQAAMAAPTACNHQPWEFVVVNDQEIMDRFRKDMPFGKYNAPMAIIVCHNGGAGHKPLCDQFWVQDCSAATENILIAAVALGLGTVWLGVHPVKTLKGVVSRIIDLPRNVEPLNVIYIGYPAEEKDARSQYEEKRVHWQRYLKK